MAARAPLQQGNALKTQNGTQEDNTGNLKQHCKRAMSSEDQMWIKFGFFILITALLKMLYYCWHAKAKHPILLHKFTSYFPKLIWHYLFTGEGREKMAVDGFSQAPLRLSWEQRISKFEKKINSLANAQININSEMTIQEDVFTSVEMSNSRLSLIALRNLDSSPASFIPLFKGT